jgi:hypothetical protein
MTAVIVMMINLTQASIDTTHHYNLDRPTLDSA